MPENNNKKNNNNVSNNEKDTRKPLPKGSIIGERPEVFNLTTKNMYKEK